MSKLVSDLFDIAEFAHHGPENLFISVIKIIGSFLFLFLINWRLAIPLALLVVCMFLFSMHQNRRMQETFMENRRKIGDVNASLQDTLAGIRVVQSFANEEIEEEKFHKSNHAFLLSKRDNYKCMGSFMAWNLFFQGMMYLTTLVFGGYLIAKGQMQVGDLAMYALYIGIFVSPIQILVELVEMIQKGLSGFRRFLDVMETEPEILDSPDATALSSVQGSVSYEDVSFHYSDDNTPVLSHVSFQIPAGKSIALVGPSGSGKTTICSLLPRFYDVTGGRITIDGKRCPHPDTSKPAKSDRPGTAGCLSILWNHPGKHCLRKTGRFYGRNYRCRQKGEHPTHLSVNCLMAMTRLSASAVPDCPEDKNNGLPLPGYF